MTVNIAVFEILFFHQNYGSITFRIPYAKDDHFFNTLMCHIDAYGPDEQLQTVFTLKNEP